MHGATCSLPVPLLSWAPDQDLVLEVGHTDVEASRNALNIPERRQGLGKPVPHMPPGCLLFSWRVLAPCQESTTRASSVVQTGFALEDAKAGAAAFGQGPCRSHFCSCPHLDCEGRRRAAFSIAWILYRQLGFSLSSLTPFPPSLP